GAVQHDHVAARTREQRETLAELLRLDGDGADLGSKRGRAILSRLLQGRPLAGNQRVDYRTHAPRRHHPHPLASRPVHRPSGFVVSTVTLLESAPFSYKARKHVIAKDIKKQVLRSRCALAQDDKARV